ncbi:M13 family metallopeptidase [Solimicrobium silvestre]|uniref:Putative metalloendopeptidase n=1 Tax=Solimicrobium silvestre TaxID=2099400 RepID=A0A2S9GT70_9BURK|nr:M13 family metallopeptidase [Solimicrobium silvestre]PRC90919.1 putative metalloendopeptidase [Solimicrobium silvestre]
MKPSSLVHKFTLKPLALTCLALCFAGATLPAYSSEYATDSAASKPSTTFTIDGMNTGVKPGDDFNAYANGGWEKTAVIPADQSSWGIFGEINERTNKQLSALIQAATQAAPGSEERKVGDFYTAFMDTATIEKTGIAPLKARLDSISALKNKADLSTYLGANLKADVDPINATSVWTENLFGMWISQGFHDNTTYTAYLLQGGLGLPDREYYLTKNPKMVELRAKYRAYVAAMLKLAGIANPEQAAIRVVNLEQKIAITHAPREDTSNVLKADNTWAKADFSRKAAGMDWANYFAAAGLTEQASFIIWHPSAVKGEAALVASVSLADWQDYLRFHAINSHASVLPKAFSDQKFAFYGTTMSGTPEQQERSIRAIEMANGSLGDALGKLYVAKHFSPEAKAKVRALVSNLLDAFSQRITTLDWMAPSTKAEAQAKLKSMYVGVGYPDTWRDFSGLEIRADDAFGNLERAQAYTYQQALAKLGKPVDVAQWCMVAQEINAVNMPMQNAINFPAAILQAPYFDINASDAANYGSIGATIGHEISHSFDDSGAQFDSKGELRNWWQKSDFSHFKKSAKALAAQYSAYRPFPDLAINGQQTLSENIADLAGLNVAYDAFHKASGKQDAATDKRLDQEFFLSYAESWRGVEREQALRRQITTNEHAPDSFRVFTVRNLDAWYGAFDVQAGEKLYLAPKDRVRVW